MTCSDIDGIPIGEGIQLHSSLLLGCVVLPLLLLRIALAVAAFDAPRSVPEVPKAEDVRPEVLRCQTLNGCFTGCCMR